MQSTHFKFKIIKFEVLKFEFLDMRKQVFQNFYNKLNFKTENYGLNVYCPGMNSKTFKNFFSVRLVNRNIKIEPNKDYFMKTWRSPFYSKRKTEELLLVNAINKSLSRNNLNKKQRNYTSGRLPKINSAAAFSIRGQDDMASQNGSKIPPMHTNTKAKPPIRFEQSGSISPEFSQNPKFNFKLND